MILKPTPLRRLCRVIVPYRPSSLKPPLQCLPPGWQHQPTAHDRIPMKLACIERDKNPISAISLPQEDRYVFGIYKGGTVAFNSFIRPWRGRSRIHSLDFIG